MGCGESKHAVATGNTISRKSSRAGSKRVEASETIETTSNKDVGKTSSMVVKEEGKNVSGGDNSGPVVADHGKNMADQSTELKKEAINVKNDENKSGGVKENNVQIAEKSVSNENVKVAVAVADALEGQETKEEAVKEKELAQGTKMDIKTENVGGKTLGEETKSEIKLVEETKEKAKEDALEDKKVAEDAKGETVKDQKLAEEKKEETAKGEPETVKEENLVKEAGTAETSETIVSTPDEEKEKESAVSPAADDLKKE
ncbi:hypothetical protein PTKIN_Ptkin10aG0021900 [Pterospermum kingtungense]